MNMIFKYIFTFFAIFSEKLYNIHMKTDFYSRYDKFKKNNLPTPFWDEERQTREYVNLGCRRTIYTFDENPEQVEVNTNLIEALKNVAQTDLYYPFICRYKVYTSGCIKEVFDHAHSYSFENVVGSLYQNPESFKIAKEDEEFYSKQELKYLREVQKYLLFIGLKDVKEEKIPNSRYQNEKYEKYKNAFIWSFDDSIIENMINGKLNFTVKKYYDSFKSQEFKSGEYQVLITNKEYDFKLFIENIYDDVKLYKDIKNIYKINNLVNDDKVIVTYFKILEYFD